MQSRVRRRLQRGSRGSLRLGYRCCSKSLRERIAFVGVAACRGILVAIAAGGVVEGIEGSVTCRDRRNVKVASGERLGRGAMQLKENDNRERTSVRRESTESKREESACVKMNVAFDERQ